MDVSKKVCDREGQFSSRNEGGTQILLCKNIDISLTFKEVGIYLKYSTPHPLWKLVKMG